MLHTNFTVRTFTFLLLLLLGNSCELIQCPFKKLDDRQCPSGYDCIKKLDMNNFPIHRFPNEEVVMINSQEALDSLWGDFQQRYTIDFTTHSLVVVNGNTQSAGHDYEVAGSLCRRQSDGILLIAIDYSLAGQCNGSGIDIFSFSTWTILPKIPNDENIRYQAVNVNPDR
ncbi:MAG: hypothetical protein ACFB10_10580 [Salibacteraceae bacterium]